MNTVHHSPGVIIRITRYKFMDQLDSSMNPWEGSKSNLILRVKELYNLSESEYYNLVVKGNKDDNKECKNPGCNGVIISSLLLKRIDYCCRSCVATHTNLNQLSAGSHVSNNPDFYKSFQLAGSNANIEKGKLGIHQFQIDSTRHKIARGNFISKYESSGRKAYLYITGDNSGYIKFGITTQGYSRSLNRLERSTGFYKSIHIIKEGSVVDIAELEFRIKDTLNPKNLNSTEIIKISELNKLLEIVRKTKIKIIKMENTLGGFSNDPFADLMNELEQKAATKNKGERKEYVKPDLVKLFMNVPTNHGSFFILPVQEDSNRSISMLDNVMEMKLKVGNWDKTVRIAEKDCYSNLSDPTSKESILFDEISSMFNYLRKEGYDYNIIKYKSYSLIFAYVLSQFDQNGTNISNNFPALFCIGDKGFRDTFREEMKKKMSLAGGNLNWMGDYFNRKSEGRSHLINFNYKRTTNYSSSLAYTPITQDYYGLTGGETTAKFNEEFLTTCFTSHVDKFFNLDNGVFNYDLFVPIKEALFALAERFNKSKALEQASSVPATPAMPGTNVGPLS